MTNYSNQIQEAGENRSVGQGEKVTVKTIEESNRRGGDKCVASRNQNRLLSLRRPENLRKRHKKKDQMTSRFFNDPYRFMKTLFAKEKSGRLVTKREDLEVHLKEVHSYIHCQDPMVLPPSCHHYLLHTTNLTSALPSGVR